MVQQWNGINGNGHRYSPGFTHRLCNRYTSLLTHSETRFSGCQGYAPVSTPGSDQWNFCAPVFEDNKPEYGETKERLQN
jgi:hypothetical protein